MQPKKQDLFARRRARFLAGMKEGVALFIASPEAFFGHDTAYRYRPDPDFQHLTGFAEPGAIAVLDADRKVYTLFVRRRDRVRESWEGRRAGPEGAVADFGADAAYPTEELAERLPELIRSASVLHVALGISPDSDRLVLELLARFRREARDPRRGPSLLKDPTDLLHEMRLFKEPEEVALLERSAAIAARAHRDAMRLAAPGRYEYQLEAVIEKRFKAEGASGPAYSTIVGSGENATILHYVENRRQMRGGELVLVDAGCEYEGYASDITRTFPVSGTFSRVQQRFYEVVLAAQTAAIAAVRPGTPFDDVHAAARDVLIDGLIDLGLLKGRRSSVKAHQSDQRFILHRTSHWLGRDVHDRGRYMDASGSSRPLEAGMVLTVEPGLYVRTDEAKVPSKFLGLGVRIEDDVLVTADGNRVLTDGVPRRPDELSELMGRK
ncbi:MAG: aminopeptidase P N-terminal domain-containing protein [Thermoanaerobaculia bacterium]